MRGRKLVGVTAFVTAMFGTDGVTQARVPAVHSSGSVGKAAIPVRAKLASLAVQFGDTERITIQTLPNTGIFMRVIYPQSGGFKNRATSDARGSWQHRWVVHAVHRGAGSVSLDFNHGSVHRHYTLHFRVVADVILPTPELPLTATPTATVTPTPTIAPSPTPTSRIPPPPPGQVDSGTHLSRSSAAHRSSGSET